MQNPFNHENYPSNELKRNTFPCSYQFNTTMKYGYIYPAGVWRTIPGATYKIKPTLGLNFMPTVFPVQTRQKVYVHYFYGRDRNFWKDYKDFVNGQRPDLVKPYIDESVTKARTGKLLDYLGVPTTIVGAYGMRPSDTSLELLDSSLGGTREQVAPGSSNDIFEQFYFSSNAIAPDKHLFPEINFTPSSITFDVIPYDSSLAPFQMFRTTTFKYNGEDLTNGFQIRLAARGDLTINGDIYYSIDSFLQYLLPENNGGYPYVSPISRSENTILNRISVYFIDSENKITAYSFHPELVGNGVINFKNIVGDLSSATSVKVCIPVVIHGFYQSGSDERWTNYYVNSNDYIYPLSFCPFVEQEASVVDIDDSTSPYWRSGATTDLRERIKLNAYLPRFYETVYNLYYRNPQNNPYMLEGRPEYNKFIPSKDGGVDSNLYELRRRNWEDDFLTTAVQSPQQGIAPLVGLTDRGVTLTLTDDDGSVTRYNVTTTENGSITGIEANDTSAEPILTKALIDAVSYGISIEDIRNVNAMQKWLELNLRKGYQYKDIIQARWGISISYNELDLPEFIGGFSRDVQLQAVTQTANVNDDVTGQLGWQAGRLYASGDGREITHYCDEEGFIMCLITVVPVPNYSQLLPKHWIERDLLDSYQPEFNHIGFQPITYKEVCPVQAYQESTENVNVLEQTFGYQRPWYQYFNYTDEVHGQFRTTFKDFLINRVFDVKPELSESFLLVDPKQINDVFNVPDVDDDKIVGAIYHNCEAKLPISLYAQARLE